jgi:hypothetical protein
VKISTPTPKKKKQSVKLALGHKNLNILGVTLQIEELISIDNYLLTNIIGKVIKIELITSFWVCPQVTHDALSMDGVQGGCWFTISKFQKFSVKQFQHGNFSRNVLYDHSISVGTSLKTLTLTCPYKNIRKAQRQHRLIFQCFFSNSYNFTHKLSNKWAHVCTFSEGGEEELQACRLSWVSQKIRKKGEKRLTSFFPATFAKLSDR